MNGGGVRFFNSGWERRCPPGCFGLETCTVSLCDEPLSLCEKTRSLVIGLIAGLCEGALESLNAGEKGFSVIAEGQGAS